MRARAGRLFRSWLLGGVVSLGAAAGCERALSAEIVAELPPVGAPPAALDVAEPELPLGVDLPVVHETEHFFEVQDSRARAALLEGEIDVIRIGRGGRSTAFRVELEDGTRGYFKPEQHLSSADYRAEIAAFHLDRELGLGRVPAVTGRWISAGRLEAVLGQRAERAGIVVQAEGRRVRGAFVWWIPERLEPAPLGVGWERWLRFGDVPSVTPFQRARAWASDARGEGGSREPEFELPHASAVPSDPRLVGDLSDLVLFDYLIHNIDRWGSAYANVLVRERGGPLVFLDNAAAFVPYHARFDYMDRRLETIQRFRRSTVAAIRDFSLERFADRCASDPTGPLLSDEQLAHVETRRAALLGHVASMLRTHGDRIWLD